MSVIIHIPDSAVLVFFPTSHLPCLLRLGIIFGTMMHPALTAEDPRILSRWGFSVRSVEPSLDGLVTG